MATAIFLLIGALPLCAIERRDEGAVDRILHHLRRGWLVVQIADAKLKTGQHQRPHHAIGARQQLVATAPGEPVELRFDPALIQDVVLLHASRRILGELGDRVAVDLCLPAVGERFDAQVEDTVIAAIMLRQRHAVAVQYETQVGLADGGFGRQRQAKSDFYTQLRMRTGILREI
jgi:hypothetical protein